MILASDRTISSSSRLPVAEGAAAHLPGLDLLRAIAILLVFAYHASVFFAHPAELRSWAAFGWTGVDLFFVLSGFLITSQLLEVQARGPINLTGYFLKRGFRILPAYWLVLAVYFLIPAWRETESPAPLWKYLTFTQNLGLDTVNNRTFSHAWSLCIEEQFYLALPLRSDCTEGEAEPPTAHLGRRLFDVGRSRGAVGVVAVPRATATRCGGRRIATLVEGMGNLDLLSYAMSAGWLAHRSACRRSVSVAPECEGLD